ncbi:MAG: hypothetical protein K9J79_00220 [Desulfobacteraceae bacterium]|nr:hypothetical protein [Desulfobacteraceae bacterium]
MTHKDEDDIGAQVSSRLEELFGEQDEQDSAGPAGESAEAPGKGQAVQADPAEDNVTDPPGYPLKNLKAYVFGIDWEITDESMKEFLEEVRGLQSKYQHDKLLSTFLKLHESVGKYIRAKKARAHPEAIKFVASVFKSFEKVLMTPDMPESRKKSLLSAEIKKFKNFREKVMAAGKTRQPEPADAIAGKPEEKPTEASEHLKEEPPTEGETYQAEPAETEGSAGDKQFPAEEPKPAAVLENQEALDYIVAELRKTIKAEFHTIRQIIKNLGA